MAATTPAGRPLRSSLVVCREKRLMCLGAGPSQLPLIKKAVDSGLYVITVDYLPENIGHRVSHHYVNCSTADKEGVLKAARELDIDGIITCASDVATSTAGFVADQLGLPGAGSSVAESMSSKARFRASQREHGLNCPNFLIGQRLQDIEEQIHTLSPPLMFKPVASSGSRGVSRVDEIGHNLCSAAFSFASGYSRSKAVCVEEFIEGIEVGGDGFLVDGQLFAAITHKHKQSFVPTGHSLPTNICAADQERVLAELVRNCRSVDYAAGVLNFDVIVSDGRATVLEMSPRLGGNGIPMIIERGTGVDLIAAAIRFALGEEVELSERLKVVRSCGSWVFGSSHGGLLEGIATGEEVKSAVPEVFEYVTHYHIGDRIPEFAHSANSLGYVLFDCPPQLNYHRIVDRLKRAVQLKVA
jgi:formate-dependent phosphoribosylglycinamide formyltransferase (GAR transformylase)